MLSVFKTKTYVLSHSSNTFCRNKPNKIYTFQYSFKPVKIYQVLKNDVLCCLCARQVKGCDASVEAGK